VVSVLTCGLTGHHNVTGVIEMVKPHVVMHLSAPASVSESFAVPVTHMETNAIGTTR